MKKILLVTRPICPPWDEGSKNFAYALAKNIADFDFYLLTNGIIPNLPKNIHQKPIYTSNNFSYLQKIRLIKHLRKIRNDFDVLHYLFTPTKQNSFLIKRFASSKKSKSIQTIATLREDLFSDDEIKKLMFGDLIITYSKYAKNKLNALGFDNVEQIYPGIDLSLYSPAPKNISLMQQLGINFNDFVITYPGEYTRLGATDNILKTAISICHSERIRQLAEKPKNLNIRSLDKARDDKIMNIKFIFACRVKNKKDLEKREEIRKILKENGLASQVLLPDTFTTMEKVYNLSDVVIFPVENMKGKFDVPLAVIEAMACAKPVIVSDILILQEFTNGQNSVKIESGDPKKLMEAVLDLYQNKEKREVIGKNARKFAEENFDIKKIAEKYQEVYKNL
jgi:phosphatidylinositol alpha-1,6-mannosyltransferase